MLRVSHINNFRFRAQKHLTQQWLMRMRCGGCNHQIDAQEGMRMFLRKHMPNAHHNVEQSLTSISFGNARGTHQFGVNANPMNERTADVLNGALIECPKCGSVRWGSRTDGHSGNVHKRGH